MHWPFGIASGQGHSLKIPMLSYRIRVKPLAKGLLCLGLAFAASAVAIAILAPLLEFYRSPLASKFYSYLALSCHQIPSRCFWILGSNTGLCARCLGVYLGYVSIWIILISSLRLKSLTSTNRPSSYIALLLFPLILDAGLQMVSSYNSGNITRFFTGYFFGIGAGFILFSYVQEGKNESI